MSTSSKTLKERLLRDLSRFIRLNTVSSRGNGVFAADVGRMLEHRGFRVHYQRERVRGHAFVNVIGKLGQGKGGLLLTSHLDTVPPGVLKKWTQTKGNPWKPAVRDGSVYGLGAADDKGPMLAMIYAGGAFRPQDLRRPLYVAGTYGEESGMGGAKLLIRRWKDSKPQIAIAGEPTKGAVTYRHKGIGVLVLEIKISRFRRAAKSRGRQRMVFHGRQGHSSRPWTGDNALVKAVHYLRKMCAGNPYHYVTGLKAGHAPNLIPDHVEMVLSQNSLHPQSRYRSGLTGHAFPSRAIITAYDIIQKQIYIMRPLKDSSFKPSVLTSNFAMAETRRNTLSLTFDFRMLPGQVFSVLFERIQRGLHRAFKAFPGLRLEVRTERDNPPLGLGKKHFLPQHLLSLMKTHKLAPHLVTKPSCTEAGVYMNWGVPSVVIGPGESVGNIHSPNESIRIRDIQKAIRFYQICIESFCGGKKLCS